MKGGRWDDKMCQERKKVTANYPSARQILIHKEKKGIYNNVVLKGSDIWEERDFKMWMTALINQWSVSNQTSKPLIAEGWWLSRMIHWWKWWANEARPSSSPWGGGTNSCIPASIECVKVSPFETLTFDPGPWCSYKQYTDMISDSTLLHIVGARNMIPVKECSPPWLQTA